MLEEAFPFMEKKRPQNLRPENRNILDRQYSFIHKSIGLVLEETIL